MAKPCFGTNVLGFNAINKRSSVVYLISFRFFDTSMHDRSIQI